MKRKKTSVTSICKTIPAFGSCHIVAPLAHLLWISLTPKQLEAINNPLCYITDQINVTEVELSVPFIFFFLAVYYF